jgi:Uma2 family endonuclease
MTTVMSQPEQAAQKVIRHHISWETYERLLTEHGEGTGTRFVYDRGTLEIMIVSLKHEKLKDILIDLFTVIADEREMDFVKVVSTTFRSEILDCAFEPDACFYMQNADSIRDKD